MNRVFLLAALGFMVGAVAGFIYGGRVKDGVGDAVKSDYKGGVITVQLDAVQALKSGLPVWLGK